ncbi:MAG: class I SAM-dependent methyltransferase [Chloroflexi bacterium]|nr:class I SAM-dependent methyltransferase [Chloroflexota bacterium]
MSDVWQVLSEIYGDRVRSFQILYDLSNAHRAEHGEASCTVYPNRASKAPMWPFLTELVGARRFLEIGCGIGYTAALMAEAAGSGGHVDAIEKDPIHAEIARREFARPGLDGTVSVLEGEATSILKRLTEPYDVVHLDTEVDQYVSWLPDLVRLVKPGGMLVTSNMSTLISDWDRSTSNAPIKGYVRALMSDQRFASCLFEGTVILSYRRR